MPVTSGLRRLRLKLHTWWNDRTPGPLADAYQDRHARRLDDIIALQRQMLPPRRKP